MASFIATHSITLKLALSLLLGLLIGLDRQFRQHHTGLVTHALVALGAASHASLPAHLAWNRILGRDPRWRPASAFWVPA